jgi:hypothetical protein
MRYCIIIPFLFALLSSCAVSHILPAEAPLLPLASEGKWWIINTVSKDKNGKDIHICALISTDFSAAKKYAGCFISTWSEADSSYSYGVQTIADPKIKNKEQFPVSIKRSAEDSLSGDFSWTLNRNETILQTILTKKDGASISPASLEALAKFETQKPFTLAHMIAFPDIWTARPLNANISLSTDSRSRSKGKLFLSAISGKNVLFEWARREYVTWLDISLNTGEQMSLLLMTDNKGNVKVEAALLWDKSGNFMLRSGIQVSTISKTSSNTSKPYPLYYSIGLPTDNIYLSEVPRMQNQEIVNNKGSFWMGAVEVFDPKTGKQQGRGNMYIFKL